MKYESIDSLLKKIFATTAVVLSATGALAAPVQWTAASGGNDHYYELVYAAADWDTANAAAMDSSYMGQAGYLATITSAAENAFVASLGLTPAIIGGSDAGTEGSFIWTDGPEAGQAITYTNWAAGEPNNQGDEDFIQINFRDVPGAWNDIPGSFRGSYIVEYGSLPAAVPLPASLPLLLFGLGAFAAVRRRR